MARSAAGFTQAEIVSTGGQQRERILRDLSRLRSIDHERLSCRDLIRFQRCLRFVDEPLNRT